MHEGQSLSLLPQREMQSLAPDSGLHTPLAVGMGSPCPAAPTHSLQGTENPEVEEHEKGHTDKSKLTWGQ